MKFLLAVIQKFFEQFKFIKNPMEFWKKIHILVVLLAHRDDLPPIMLNGQVRMLRYRNIRLGKMKFLLPVIENFFEKF